MFKTKRLFLPTTLISIAAVLLLLIRFWPYAPPINAKSQISSLERNLQQRVSEADSLIDWVLQNRFSTHSFGWIESNGISEKSVNKNISLFITQNDSLVFWSDSDTPFPSFASALNNGSVFFNGNGYYFSRCKTFDSSKVYAFGLIERNYFYHNSYLPAGFSDGLCNDCSLHISNDSLLSDTLIIPEGLIDPIHLSYKTEAPVFSKKQEMLIITVLFLSLLFLAIGAFRLILYFRFFKNNTLLRFVALFLTTLFLYWLGIKMLSMTVFQTLNINSPGFFAFSEKFSSLRPFIMTVFGVLLLIVFAAREIVFHAGSKTMKFWKKALIFFITFTATTLSACFVIDHLVSLLFNTSLTLDFNDILTFDIRSLLLLFTLFLLFSIVIALHYILVSLVGRLRLSFLHWVLFSAIILVLTAPIAILAGFGFSMYLPVALWLIAMQFLFSRLFYSNKTIYLFLHLVLAAGMTTVALNQSLTQKQSDQLKLLSLNLASEQDPLTEEFLGDILPEIARDTLLKGNPFSIEGFSLNEYLRKQYFNGYLSRYILQTTWCNQNEKIMVQPADTAVVCKHYFDDVAFRFGIPTLADKVVFINDGTGRGYYLCSVDVPSKKDTASLFIELIPASYEKGLGYPDLLVDVNSGIKTVPSYVSYARFLDGELVSRFGKYNYPTRINRLFESMPDETVVHDDGYIHFKVTVNDHLKLILTQNDRDLASVLAPFSYILLFFGILTLIFLIITGRLFNLRVKFSVSFSGRLQWMIITVILIIFFVAGLTAVFNLESLNTSKNNEVVSEKAHSLIVELEHKLSGYESLSTNDEPYLTELLLKFSRVFFTDLNLYNTNGLLLATTRSQIFEKELVSDRMNANAFLGLREKNYSFLLQTEKIGNLQFSSAYIPLRNQSNQVIGFLNLPYFARESELNREISSFISTFINIYMLIIIITVLITVLISNYVTQPLRLIKDKLRNIKLGSSNEKIRWKRRDEIGELVFEYNRMIEELALKAEMLARNEREMAWREMARQVAHEIKNPLTPMKLSTQYLEKAWNDKAPDFNERLKRFSQTMTEQIDSLSDIATAFSSFGKLPESSSVKICINDIIGSVVTLYRNDEYDITLQMPETALFVLADESQLLRVFNNLLKNAQQAFVTERRGSIMVSLKQSGEQIEVIVQDNGCGISDEMQKKIFQPNFTTKSSGSGLGLAMVKNIVQGFGGNITFKSEQNVGSVFTVMLPQA